MRSTYLKYVCARAHANAVRHLCDVEVLGVCVYVKSFTKHHAQLVIGTNSVIIRTKRRNRFFFAPLHLFFVAFSRLLRFFSIVCSQRTATLTVELETCQHTHTRKRWREPLPSRPPLNIYSVRTYNTVLISYSRCAARTQKTCAPRRAERAQYVLHDSRVIFARICSCARIMYSFTGSRYFFCVRALLSRARLREPEPNSRSL